LVLTGLFQSFDSLATTLARLHEDLNCLEDEALLHDLGVLLVAAATIQQKAVSWKALLVATPSSYDAKPRGWISRAMPVRRTQDHAPLAEFLEEALAAGDDLDSKITLYRQRREHLVAMARMEIEAGACARL
jgi:hypothetical protein